jgi:hypothetical protein
MDDAYYRWLVQFLGDEYLEMNYQKLLYKLYATDFYWELEYDGNRATDGLYLRTLFTEEMRGNLGVSKIVTGAQCSVLEMLIALAKKTEHDIMYNPFYGDRTCKWFWVMLENLGLDIYDDYGYFEESVDRILYVFMHHLYASDGSGGGMFPNKFVERDLRKTDIWWQLNAFLEKNYPV